MLIKKSKVGPPRSLGSELEKRARAPLAGPLLCTSGLAVSLARLQAALMQPHMQLAAALIKVVLAPLEHLIWPRRPILAASL